MWIVLQPPISIISFMLQPVRFKLNAALFLMVVDCQRKWSIGMVKKYCVELPICVASCSSIQLDSNTNIMSCSSVNFPAEEYASKMQFNITEKKSCEYQKFGLYSDKMCESMYYDYSPLRTDYPELQIDISDFSNVNPQDFTNMLDEEMSRDVNAGEWSN